MCLAEQVACLGSAEAEQLMYLSDFKSTGGWVVVPGVFCKGHHPLLKQSNHLPLDQWSPRMSSGCGSADCSASC